MNLLLLLLFIFQTFDWLLLQADKKKVPRVKESNMNESIIKESSKKRPGGREGGSQRRQQPHRCDRKEPKRVESKRVKRGEEGIINRKEHTGSGLKSPLDQDEKIKNRSQ